MLERFHLEHWDKKRSVPFEQIRDRFHIIVSGRVRVERINEDTGRTITLFLLSPGDIFDVLQLLTNSPCEGVLIAIDDLELLTISTTQARQWIGSHSEFNLSFLPYLGQQIRTLAHLSGDLALHDTETRLAHLIMRHLDRKKDGHFHIPLINNLSHEVLASLIGSVRAVVNRHLQHWRKRGLIRLNHGHIHIEKIETLLNRTDHYQLPKPGNKK
ncbi:MAG: Crp/Fnr family transcriptional regulator [Hyphomicrobiaceae bacterium]|nr:Crp/Fnr family transcriptional regulator [Hyphomicrobiaceae bacterium]